jgi:hypothetical protein
MEANNLTNGPFKTMANLALYNINEDHSLFYGDGSVSV